MKRNDKEAITQFAVEMFNACVLVGSSIIYIDDHGNHTEAKTRSQAWIMPSGMAVVRLAGKSGCYSLERVRITERNVEEAKRHQVSSN